MNQEWIFVSNGMLFVKGPKKLAKNGTLGVTSAMDIFLYNDKNEIIDHAAIAQVAIKFSTFTGDSIKMNGNKYGFSFERPMSVGASMMFSGAIGALASGAAHGMENADNAERRKQFIKLIEGIQTGAVRH